MQNLRYFHFITTKRFLCLQVYDEDAVCPVYRVNFHYNILLFSLLSIELFDPKLLLIVSVIQIHKFVD
jgi:hypothetical protein